MEGVTILAILAVLGTGVVGEVTMDMTCNQMTAIDHGLFALSQFAWATDRIQSKPWLNHSKMKPLHVSEGVALWEGNELIAESPELFGTYTLAPLHLTRQTMECLPATYSVPLVGLMLSKHLYDISSNNKVRQEHLNLPPVWAVGWTWTF